VTELRKTLAQNYPVANRLTTLYTVPVITQTVVSSFIVCNQSSYDDLFRMSVAVGGETDSPKQYLYYNVAVPGNDSFVANIGMTLSADDVVRVYSTNGFCSFNLFGVEIT